MTKAIINKVRAFLFMIFLIPIVLLTKLGLLGDDF